ncbi:uncharacterized protein [Typha angustifolia]|uniref:uncharacterized protein n=1 Tax=Typha angustifolia TaxID=59011 RepID=UPI003C2BB5A4
MRSRLVFRSILSRSFSNHRFAAEFSDLFHHLSKSPSDPRTLRYIDSMLANTHLLDSTTSSLLVLRLLSHSKKLVRAKTVLANLTKKSTIPIPFLYSLVFQCLLPCSPIKDVELVWNEVVGELQCNHFNASDFVLHLCRRGRNAAEIEVVFRRVSFSKSRLSLRGYVALIGSLCGVENPNPFLAREVLREMEEKGFEADEFTYFALFRSFCRLGYVSEADSVLRNLIERRNYEVDSLIFANFFYGLCKSGKLREARKLFDKIVKKDHNLEKNLVPVLRPGRRVIFQLNSLARVSEVMAFEAYFLSLCSTGRVEEAERLLKDNTWKKAAMQNCVYRSFVEALFNADRSKDAIEFFEAERKKGHVYIGDIAIAVVVGLCKMGRVDDGILLLCKIVDDGFVPTACVWNQVLKSLWEEERLHEGKDLFDRMRSGRLNVSARPDASTYSIMIHGLLQKGETDAAISLLHEMVREKVPVNVHLYSTVAQNLYQHGRIEESHSFLNLMVENGSLVSYAAWEAFIDSMTTGSKIKDLPKF